MATKYIVTQIWSIRHIVTRGFGAFVDVDYGQGEIIELGNAYCAKNLTVTADVSREKDLIAQVLMSPVVSVER